MSRWIGSLRRKSKTEAEERALETKTRESYNALVEAATSTMALAKDVTLGLRDRIEDYAGQINATSMIITDALIILDDAGKVETSNQSVTNVFGYSQEEIIGKTIQDLFVDSTLKPVDLQRFSRIISNGKPSITEVLNKILLPSSEVKGKTKYGKFFDVRIKASMFTRVDGTSRYVLLVEDITAEVEAERKYIELYEKQNAIIKALPDTIILLDANWTILQVYALDSFFINSLHTGSNMLGLLSNDMRKEFKERAKKLKKSNDVESWEIEIPYQRCESMYYEVRMTKTSAGYLVIFRDITDAVLTKAELLESEDHFRAFAQVSNEAMMIHNDEEIVTWNAQLIKMSGFSRKEIRSMTPVDFIHPLERVSFMENSKNVEKQTYNSIMMTKGGKPIEVTIEDQIVDWKNHQAQIKVIRDISDIKDITDLLNLSRERYRTITDNTFDLVCCLDANNDLSFINQTFMDYFGIENFTPYSFNLLLFVDPRDQERIISNIKSLNVDNPIMRTLFRVRRNGEVRFLDWIDRAVYGDKGDLIEVQSIGRDVTDYIKHKPS